MFNQKKFLVYMSIFLSLGLACLLRLDTPSNNDGGRASIEASAVGIEAKFIPHQSYDLAAKAIDEAYWQYSVNEFLKAVQAKREAALAAAARSQPATSHHLIAASAGPASIVTQPSNPSIWDRIAACESHNIWNLNTGNGYFGGLQMDMPFWTTYDGLDFAPRPDLATREQQIIIAERARDGYTTKSGRRIPARSYAPWPTCRRRVGV